MTNATEISKPFKRTNPGPIDVLYGPYDSLAIACQQVPDATKEVDGINKNFRTGQVIGINTLEGIVEYWWPKNTSDSGLIRKENKIDLSTFATKDDLNAFSNGTANATIEDSPEDKYSVYNISDVGVYSHFGGIEVLEDDFKGNLVQFRRFSSGWKKVLVPVAESTFTNDIFRK